jgi:hypothetical protein
MAVFWDVATCGLVDSDRRFRGAYCLHHQGDKLEYGSWCFSLWRRVVLRLLPEESTARDSAPQLCKRNSNQAHFPSFYSRFHHQQSSY